MSFWSAAPFIGTLLDKIGKFLPDKQKLSEAQSKINEQEIAGAPASRLRLWRSFLGWILALCFVWEVPVRLIITTYFPDVELPPPMLDEVSRLLFIMLGWGG